MADHLQRSLELRALLERASHLYYNKGDPALRGTLEGTLSDAEYDRLYTELEALERDHPDLVSADSPTQRVGAPLPAGSSFAKAQHLLPMLSIASLTSADEVREFEQRVRRQLDLEDADVLRWALEPKFDGVSANLCYEHGTLVRGLSRGDGTQGEDITQNLRTIRNLPLRLQSASSAAGKMPKILEVRGEVMLSRSAFRRLQERTETSAEGQFRNPRNTVSGSLKLLDPTIVAERGLEFVFWGIGQVDGMEWTSYQELREQISAYGFKTSDEFEVVEEIEAVIAFHDQLEARREEIDYDMDGIVAKLDDLGLQRRMGRTARTPRSMLAHKFAPQHTSTRVIAIVAQVGRTGTITPVANLEPAELAGVTVRRATLHNWGLLAERDVRIGDLVEIERAGDVIPAVISVQLEQRDSSSKPTEPPDSCPSCEGELEQEGAFLYCVNLECPDQLRGHLVHLASRRALEILRLGPKMVDQLMAAGLLNQLEDVFTLTEKRSEILKLDRWAEKSFDNLVVEITKAKTPDLQRFVYGLGIRHVGAQIAKDLAEAMGSFAAIECASQEQLLEVNGIGAEVAKSIRNFFARPQTKRFLKRARAAGLRVQPMDQKTLSGPLSGRTFCFTGGLIQISRDQAKLMVEAMGARSAASITKQVTDVVAGAKAGSKLAKAKKLGLEIMSEEEFLEIVGGAS